MNENYLLHNETAKKLYFEYAKDLPIIALCSLRKPSDKVYNNLTEAFLRNDVYKLDAMRHCRLDEKYITGDASDYEKFKAFCSVLYKFAGHPIYLLSHIELRSHFGCELEINEQNCDAIWREVNEYLLSNSVTEMALVEKTNTEYHYAVNYSWIQELDINDQIFDLPSLESTLLGHIKDADDFGCKIALYNAFSSFVKPNPFLANEIVKGIKLKKMNYDLEDCDLVDMQIARTLGMEYKRLGWTWLLSGNSIDEDAVRYLEQNNALPKTRCHIQYEVGQSEDHLELQFRGFAANKPIGSFICTVNSADNCLCYARNDYLRRTLCSVIGKWIEDGEYTSDETVLKRLIEDILYNNLKEAIG